MAHVIKTSNALFARNEGDASKSTDIKIDNVISEPEISDYVASIEPVTEQMSSFDYQSLIDEFKTANCSLENDKEKLENEVNELRIKLTEYQTDFENNMNNGYDEGKEQGFTSGLKDADEFINESVSQIKDLFDAIDNELKSGIIDNTDHIKDIILSALIKLISDTPSEVIVMSELDKLINNMSIDIAMNVLMSKNDYEKLNNSEYSKQLPTNIKFILDEKILPGGIIVQSKSESIDARLERKLDLFKEQLASA